MILNEEANRFLIYEIINMRPRPKTHYLHITINYCGFIVQIKSIKTLGPIFSLTKNYLEFIHNVILLHTEKNVSKI